MKIRPVIAVALASLAGLLTSVQAQGTLTLENDRFVKDGKPTQLISGRYVSRCHQECYSAAASIL